MRFCLSLACCSLLGISALQAAGLEGRQQIRSVVRADPRTGRLVRSFARVAPALRAPAVLAGAPALANNLPSDALTRLIDETAVRYALDPLLVHSVIKVESDYNPYAVSPKGAEGLMQLMPGTARRFEVANSFNPSENVEGGVRYLKHLLETFKDPQLALAAYNAGEGAVTRYGAVPPYRETTDYVRKVVKRHEQAKKAAGTKTSGEEAAALVPAPPRIEEFVDELGVVHLRTVQR